MSLAIKPDEVDRSGADETHNAADDIFAELFDPDYAEHHHSSLPIVGTLLNGTASNSSLAGIDDATALRWQYEDKMMVMGLVFGSERNLLAWLDDVFLTYRPQFPSYVSSSRCWVYLPTAAGSC
jgi:hypothetical protein